MENCKIGHVFPGLCSSQRIYCKQKRFQTQLVSSAITLSPRTAVVFYDTAALKHWHVHAQGFCSLGFSKV